MAKIILKNKVEIDIEANYLEDLRLLANLPEGIVLLVLLDNFLPCEDQQGACVASQLIDFYPQFKSKRLCSNSTEWDCCVLISKKFCLLRNEIPAYFTYLLGHELGHAYICLSDISLHIHCCLIHLCIRPASKNKIEFPRELPDEQLFDQYGKYLSQKLHGSEKLNDEIQKLKTTAHDIEIKNLEQIEKLPPSRKFDEIRKTMIDFSMPYKDELIACWKHVDTEAKKRGDKSLTSLISDYEKLFEY